MQGAHRRDRPQAEKPVAPEVENRGDGIFELDMPSHRFTMELCVVKGPYRASRPRQDGAYVSERNFVQVEER